MVCGPTCWRIHNQLFDIMLRQDVLRKSPAVLRLTAIEPGYCDCSCLHFAWMVLQSWQVRNSPATAKAAHPSHPVGGKLSIVGKQKCCFHPGQRAREGRGQVKLLCGASERNASREASLNGGPMFLPVLVIAILPVAGERPGPGPARRVVCQQLPVPCQQPRRAVRPADLPREMGKTGVRTLSFTGSSAIEYDERVLAGTGNQVQKTCAFTGAST